jgi:hypothetical protein
MVNELRINNKTYLITYAFLLLTTYFLLLPRVVFAHCPLCVAGAAAGITLTRWVGVDDSITGIWIGAFLGATAFWLLRSLGQRNKIFFNRFVGAVVYILIFVTTLWSFYKFQLIIRMDKLFGFDKLTFGMVLGSVVFYFVDIVNDFLKKKNGKSLFPYQSMVFSLGSIILVSIATYILINYYI